MKFRVIIDHSGSLCEGGRRFVVRSVLRYIRRVFIESSREVDAEFFLLNQRLIPLKWSLDEDVPETVLTPFGKSSVEAVLSLKPEKGTIPILITDYSFVMDDRTRFNSWITDTQAKVILVGDCESIALKGVYSVEQLDGLFGEFLPEADS